jgi:hypothetical protein
MSLRPFVSLAASLARAARSGFAVMWRADAVTTFAVSHGLRPEWGRPVPALGRLAAGQPQRSAVVAGTAFDGDGPSFAVLRCAPLDAGARTLGLGGVGRDFGSQRRDMFAPAFGRGRLRGRSARRPIPFRPAPASGRLPIGSATHRQLGSELVAPSALGSRPLAMAPIGLRLVAADRRRVEIRIRFLG